MLYYSLKSKSLGYFNLPFPAETDQNAIMNVVQSVKVGKDVALCQNLDDFELVCVGDYDTSTGQFSVVKSFSIDLVDIPGLKSYCDNKDNFFFINQVSDDVLSKIANAIAPKLEHNVKNYCDKVYRRKR